MSKSWGRIRIRIWIGIITKSRIRIRIDIKAMPNWFLSTVASRGYFFVSLFLRTFSCSVNITRHFAGSYKCKADNGYNTEGSVAEVRLIVEHK
jgi:hypothetical protein